MEYDLKNFNGWLKILNSSNKPTKKERKPDLKFSYKYNNVFYKLKFYNYNDTVVHCILYDSYFNKEFTSTAKCVKQDTFNFETGVRISYSKVMEKRDNYYEKFFKRIKRMLYKIEINVLVDGEDGLTYKLNKHFDKINNS